MSRFVSMDLPPTGSTPLGAREAWKAHATARLSRMSASEKRIAMEQGTQITEIAAFVQDYGDWAVANCDLRENGERSAVAEVGLTLKLHDRTAGLRTEEAVALAKRLPMVLMFLRWGRITLSRARAILKETRDLPIEKCLEVEYAILGQAENLTPGDLRRATHKAVLKVDRDNARKRHQRARKARGVSITPGEDGMVDLHASLPAEQAIAVFGVINAHAKTIRANRRSR